MTGVIRAARRPRSRSQTGLEDFEVEPGIHVMFDCHGTLDLYCWDGGKTWVVGGEPEGGAQAVCRARRPGSPRCCSPRCGRARG